MLPGQSQRAGMNNTWNRAAIGLQGAQKTYQDGIRLGAVAFL
jgi:hypothetical protein